MADQYALGLGGDAPKMLAVLWSLTALALVFVLLRLYTRLRVLRAYGLDDYFYNAAFMTLLIYDIMMTVASMYGFGRNIDDVLAIKGPVVGMESVTRAILYSAIGQTILVFGTILCKTSLALFLVRIVPDRRNHIIIWVPNGFLATGIVASLFVFWFSCQPTNYLWDRRIPGGKCTIDPGPISMYAGAWSVTVDLWYAAFPWYLLWNIQMPKREKRVIASSLSLGIIAGAFGIERAVQLKYLGSPNYIKDVVGIIIWHAAEFCSTMVCIGIPVCRPLCRDWLNTWEASRGSKTTGNGSGWMRNKDQSFSDNIFPMHTIARAQSDSSPGGTPQRQGTALGNINPTHNVITSTTSFVAAGARTDTDNTSEESILRAEVREQEEAYRRGSGIKVKTEFNIQYAEY
ncbi:hypothetical protein MKX07_004400 [Trichoderma sp. CBMAI-0711]|uniref:Rhodopsin domain-containing protein n=1 Tax=Trichoderma parareesei TaxID=858221 RepID=A0A2H2YZF7_TRIPA|nr:hypothetical protein MKX07_004400 [Trichoderma sp. CBMAI-0711]OTA01149.1 hypothetical protein A9Z42_0015130 [Trichoderma parareesei]